MGVIENTVCFHTPIPATAPALLYLPPSMAVANPLQGEATDNRA